MSRQWSVIITRRTIAAHLPFTPDHDTAHRHDPDDDVHDAHIMSR